MVFLVAAVLLRRELVALIAIAQHLPDLVLRRYPIYITAFNTANYTIDALCGPGGRRSPSLDSGWRRRRDGQRPESRPPSSSSASTICSWPSCSARPRPVG